MATIKQMKARIDRPICRPRDMVSITVLNFKYAVDAVFFEYAVLEEGVTLITHGTAILSI